jgi:type I restriction-modification system DNA methylase subunit
MANERITEDIVRSHFKNDSMFRSIKLEEQRTRNTIIRDLLNSASKKATGKVGLPEFIITFPSIMDLVVLIECKPDIKLHRSKANEEQDPAKYAVDGVLHYSKYLNHDYNVIAIAVSGEAEDALFVSNFLIRKEAQANETTDKKLLSIYDYLDMFEEKENAEKLKDQNILLFASELNQKLYNYSVPENERATLISGILIALQNKNFKKSYPIEKKPIELVEDLLKAVERVLKSNNMGDKTKILMGEYGKIAQSNNLAMSEKMRNKETGEEEQNTLLRDIIFQLDKKVFPFTTYEHIGYDILGQFYSEFIRYVNGDKKLGIVLTPQHVAELFVDIADVNVDSVIYDNCCGTGGFLIKAMTKLMELAGNNAKKKAEIKAGQLIGVEQRGDMFTYACSNMMMRGDGKSNIALDDSLSQSAKDSVKKHKPTVGLLNPPYSTGVSELEFVSVNLDCLQSKGICVAIVPIGCVLDNTGADYNWKKTLMQRHTLEAVFSMPDELFNPATSTVTVVVVFKAHVPHPHDYETFLGYWKDDGFIKSKNLGRIDSLGKWEAIKAGWVYNYKNKKEVKGQSIKRHVTPEDEWCAEAYMETDYSTLSESDFIRHIKNYVLFRIKEGQ